ncbi:hypothetical protein ACA910_012794 [Epithemia clementina (nom. ined.)]
MTTDEINNKQSSITTESSRSSSIKGPLGFFSKSCAAISNFVQTRAEKAAERKRLTKQEDFLADIDSLNRTLEMQDREKKSKQMMSGKSSQAQSEYVSMEELPPDAKNDEASQKQQQPEEPFAFFWELLRFAKNRSWKKKVMTALIVAISFYVIIDLVFLGYIMILITKLLEWMTGHPGGAVVCFLGFFIFATLFFVPPTILYFGAGYAFCAVAGFRGGFVAAVFICFIGSSLGAILAFLRSRYMMRDLVELFAKRFPIVKCLDEAMSREGFKIMALLRLCPIIPFNALNHVGGITKISLEEYTFAMIGIIPNIVLWVLVGATTNNIQNTDTEGGVHVFYITMLVCGIIFAVVGLFLLYRFGRDELHREIKAQRALSWHSYSDNSQRTSNEFDDVEEGFELIDRHPAGLIAILGIDHHGVEPRSTPEDGHDEDWLWVWA